MSGVSPPESITRRADADVRVTLAGALPRLAVSAGTPEGGLRSIEIVIGAAIAAGGTCIVPPNEFTDGSGTLVELESGVNELFADDCTQLGAEPLQPAGHGVI